MALSISTIAVADNEDSRRGKGRSVATLDGKFICAASGHIIPGAGPAQPKPLSNGYALTATIHCPWPVLLEA